jgi:hypothetical protein
MNLVVIAALGPLKKFVVLWDGNKLEMYYSLRSMVLLTEP